MSPDSTKCSLETKLPPVGNHCINSVFLILLKSFKDLTLWCHYFHIGQVYLNLQSQFYNNFFSKHVDGRGCPCVLPLTLFVTVRKSVAGSWRKVSPWRASRWKYCCGGHRNCQVYGKTGGRWGNKHYDLSLPTSKPLLAPLVWQTQSTVIYKEFGLLCL
jgi:hypothetical protein